MMEINIYSITASVILMAVFLWMRKLKDRVIIHEPLAMVAKRLCGHSTPTGNCRNNPTTKIEYIAADPTAWNQNSRREYCLKHANGEVTAGLATYVVDKVRL
jgi:hypothetical protein